jgi:hypothetical protein
MLNKMTKLLMPTKAFCTVGSTHQFVLPGAGDVCGMLEVCEDKDGEKGLFCRATTDIESKAHVASFVALLPSGDFERQFLEGLNFGLPCMYHEDACFPFVLRARRGEVTQVALMLKANCEFIQGKDTRVPAHIGECIETALKSGGHNVNFVATSSRPIEEVVKGIVISDQVKALGVLKVFNIKSTRAIKEGETIKLFYSNEFASKIRSDVKVSGKNDMSLESCAYDTHNPPHWFECKGCHKRYKLKRFRAHLNNSKNHACYKAVFGKLPMRRGDVY